MALNAPKNSPSILAAITPSPYTASILSIDPVGNATSISCPIA
jgi:hypothetical protein